MLAEPVRGEAARETEVRLAARDDVEHAGSDDAARDLRHDVRQQMCSWEPPAGPQTDRNRRIEMTAGDRTEGVRAGQNCETERQRNAGETDSDLWKCCRQHCAPAAAEDQPERSDELRG